MTAVEQFFKDLCDLGFIEYPDDSLIQDRYNLSLELEKQQIIEAHLTGLVHPLEMENEKIAELVSKKIYNVTENKTDFAVQLLIEKLTIPQDVKSYTADDAKKYILEALSKNAL